MEVAAEESRKEEDKRFKEITTRFEREKSFESETHFNQINSLQRELSETKEDGRKYQYLFEKTKSENIALQDQLENKQEELSTVVDELSKMKEYVRRHREDDMSHQRIINVLNQELTDLRSSQTSSMSSGFAESSNGFAECSLPHEHSSPPKVREMEEAMTRLRVENESLRETNEELQAQLLNKRLEEGRCLVREGTRITNSLADELNDWNEEKVWILINLSLPL